MKQQNKIIYYRESFLQSVLSDIFTFGALVGSFYVNYRWIGDNHFVAALILVLLLMMMGAKARSKSKTYTDKQQLIDDLQKELDNEQQGIL